MEKRERVRGSETEWVRRERGSETESETESKRQRNGKLCLQGGGMREIDCDCKERDERQIVIVRREKIFSLSPHPIVYPPYPTPPLLLLCHDSSLPATALRSPGRMGGDISIYIE